MKRGRRNRRGEQEAITSKEKEKRGQERVRREGSKQ